MYSYTIETILGIITIVEDNKALTHLLFNPAPAALPPDCVEAKTPLLQNAAVQLNEYLNKKRETFDLPLHPAGTPFMQSVWKCLLEIPYGETRTYKQIAEKLQKPAATRAVGQANHRNPLPILIPCHRVIGADGKLTGYGGGLEIKEMLLKIENQAH